MKKWRTQRTGDGESMISGEQTGERKKTEEQNGERNKQGNR